MIEEQVSGCHQYVVIVGAVVIQFGILYLYRFILHLCRGKFIEITVNAVFAIIALDFLLCEFKYVIEFQPGTSLSSSFKHLSITLL